MKNALVFGMILAAPACSTAKNDASVLDASASAAKATMSAFTLEGSVDQIAPAIEGKSTAVTLAFNIPCGASLKNVATFLEAAHDDKKATLFVTATAVEPNRAIACGAIIRQLKSMTLKGSFTADTLDVAFLGAPAVDAPSDLIGAIPLTKVSVVSQSSLCPEGVQCIVGGTLLNLSTTLGCTYMLGPVASQVLSVDAKGNARILVSGTALTRKIGLTARCVAPEVKAIKLSLPTQFFDKAKIVLAK
jgi:hypothetical protein